MNLTCPNCGRVNRATSKFCAQCRAQLAGILAAGTVLQNRYQIQQLLGHGGMGAVYLANDSRLGPKPVAVKENFDVSTEAQIQFQFEAHILANLDHPNLPKVTDHFIETSGRQYLVMEYVDGEDLEALQKRYPQGQLPQQQVLTWVDALLDALNYLHTQPNPIVHRDIKPANIKITPQGKVKLVDFGIAKIHRPGMLTQTAARAAGSPGFSPVEQYSGGTDARSDVYSLGATIYCLLTGQHPPDATLLAAGHPLTPPRKIRADLLPQVQNAIFRAMAVNANQRFQTAEEMRRALRQPAPQSPTRVPIAGHQPIAPLKNTRLWFAGSILIIALFFLVGIGLNRVRSSVNSSSPMVAAVNTATATVAGTFLATPIAPSSTPPPIANTALPSPTATSLPTATGDAATSTPTTTPQATLTSTPATMDVGDSNSGLRVSMQPSVQTGIKVEIRYASGAAKASSYVAIYEQQSDLSGNPIKGRRLANARTDSSGVVFFALDPGVYAVELGDLLGDNWGDEINHTVRTGQTTVLSLTLGQLTIGVRNADLLGMSGKWTGVYLQTTDISGNPIKSNRIASGRTDNAGVVTYNLVPGTYAVEIGDIAGMLWGNELNHIIRPGEQTQIIVTLGRLTVGVKNAAGEAVASRWVGIYLQDADLEGRPIKARRILSGRTANTGLISWDVTSGSYAIEIGDIIGNQWGQELNHLVNAGEETRIVLTLGRLTVGLKDSSGNPITNRYVAVYYQNRDVGGNIIRGQRFASGRTDSRGLLSWDITEGSYVVEVDNIGQLINVPVRAGSTTFTDGVTLTMP